VSQEPALWPHLFAFRASDDLRDDLDDAISIYGEMPIGTALRMLLEEPCVRESIRLRANAYRAACRLGRHQERQVERTDSPGEPAPRPPW
jgi:hypothetical protein